MYTEGICHDGAAILNDGVMMPIETIIDQLNTMRTTLEKINDIRNSIIGTQTVNFSAHVYPLVAALNEAGLEGLGYEIAREKACTLIEQREVLRDEMKAIALAIGRSETDGESDCDWHDLAGDVKKLREKTENLSQHVCDECDPENYGWVFNRVEGRGACTCMLEAEPFQILQKALESLINHDGVVNSRAIARKALHAVLPLDYPEAV